ncbi:hypothetical protein NQ318_015347 [Aromia moschata]|uniref:Golgin-45 n=1 Tax=Aromia moschata TaxID=1265417 RepID=A0AAV8YQE0_9CUCU|nr:hypothetical protein NQ318_015347 [Aromia moschata]
MTTMREIEMRKQNQNESDSDDTFKLKLQWEKEKTGYETDIKNLRETNSHLENQLKFQAQVNSELKTLLVAAVGEDLESRVQHLTEDKLALARALLNSANHLTSHQEQMEWLSGQCEVWRSKFLASSLMVEELAKWKSALTNRLIDLQEVMRNILEEHKRVYNQAIKTYDSLKLIAEKVTKNENSINLKYGNYAEVVNTNNELSEYIVKALDLEKEEIKDPSKNRPLQHTVTERNALKLLQHPVSVTSKQDALCNAVMGAAVSLGGKQMFLQHPSIHGCCPHCKGDMQNI